MRARGLGLLDVPSRSTSSPRRKPRPRRGSDRAAAPPAAGRAEAGRRRAGDLPPPPRRRPPPGAGAEPRGAGEAPQELAQAYGGIHDKNFYQILDVPPDAAADAIDGAYRRSLARFGDERWPGRRARETHDQIVELNLIIEQRTACCPTVHAARPTTRPWPSLRFSRARTRRIRRRALLPGGQVLLRQRSFASGGGVHALRPGEPDAGGLPRLPRLALFLRRAAARGARWPRGRTRAGAAHLADSTQAHELAAHVERDARNFEHAAEHLKHALHHGAVRFDLFDSSRRRSRSSGVSRSSSAVPQPHLPPPRHRSAADGALWSTSRTSTGSASGGTRTPRSRRRWRRSSRARPAVQAALNVVGGAPPPRPRWTGSRWRRAIASAWRRTRRTSRRSTTSSRCTARAPGQITRWPP